MIWFHNKDPFQASADVTLQKTTQDFFCIGKTRAHDNSQDSILEIRTTSPYYSTKQRTIIRVIRPMGITDHKAASDHPKSWITEMFTLVAMQQAAAT